MQLSVLDQSPISKGNTATETLNNSLMLAQTAEKLGYHRYWMAEHHNTNGLACSSPEIMITRIGASTGRIRIGSGGVLLPQYSPLKVAENFKMLEALFPNRIDLGLGRSPGGSQKTRLALTDGINKTLSAFPRQVQELQQFLHGDIPKEHSSFGVKATPYTNSNPDVWVLGLSSRGARHAANNGTGFTFGHFIDPAHGEEAIDTYRTHFKPAYDKSSPQVNVCVFVVCADTDEEAEQLALSQDMWLLQVEKGLDTRVPSVEEVKNHTFTLKEIEKIRKNRRRMIVGSQAKVKQELLKLEELYQTDEFLIITNIYDFNAKLRSYQLIADITF
ncbi:luciferase family oxidoreductase, group 1 [Thalassobacillus cyri]|uniref:Luciferase family oxidoreductase, group 1 n=1 Tax=Thalassobacillus cyri TaxID=571932 RepID=A0A1H4GV71_9BACI|nr:LLM class flavin-dependent oxidoreductase [Thalassobacillus cyri]SEB13453.1 luciferase family oxidoreductase, group 1 [Thalassobacillus cyri]